MRRHMLIIVVIGILAVCAAGCSPEMTNNTAPNPEALAPRAGGGGLVDKSLRDYVQTCEWIEIDFVYPTSGDKVVSVVPAGYPESQPVTIAVHRDGDTAKAGEHGTIWLPAPPRNGDTPRELSGYMLFRTRNVPADGSTSVQVHLPVTPWQDTLNWDGNFTMYHMADETTGWIAYPDGSLASVQWPDGSSYASVRLNLSALPDKDDTQQVVDQVVEPDNPGDGV